MAIVGTYEYHRLAPTRWYETDAAEWIAASITVLVAVALPVCFLLGTFVSSSPDAAERTAAAITQCQFWTLHDAAAADRLADDSSQCGTQGGANPV